MSEFALTVNFLFKLSPVALLTDVCHSLQWELKFSFKKKSKRVFSSRCLVDKWHDKRTKKPELIEEGLPVLDVSP